MAECIENVVRIEKKEIKENEPEKLNLLLKTDYAEVEKKKQNKNGDKHMQVKTAKLVWH